MWPVTATEADMPAAPADEASRLAALRARLAAPMPDDRPWGWLGPLLVTAFGWRFASAVFGSLAILLICRIARRMTRSTLLGCVAGLLMSLDGLEFVLSRTGILDVFLMFFVLAAFGCILIDRDESRAQLAEGVARRQGGQLGPRLGIRRWPVAAGICLGLAAATKWDADWYI